MRFWLQMFFRAIARDKLQFAASLLLTVPVISAPSGSLFKITVWSRSFFFLCFLSINKSSFHFPDLLCPDVWFCGGGGGFHLSPLICGIPARVSHVSVLINPHLIWVEAVRSRTDGRTGAPFVSASYWIQKSRNQVYRLSIFTASLFTEICCNMR